MSLGMEFTSDWSIEPVHRLSPWHFVAVCFHFIFIFYFHFFRLFSDFNDFPLIILWKLKLLHCNIWMETFDFWMGSVSAPIKTKQRINIVFVSALLHLCWDCLHNAKTGGVAEFTATGLQGRYKWSWSQIKSWFSFPLRWDDVRLYRNTLLKSSSSFPFGFSL